MLILIFVKYKNNQPAKTLHGIYLLRFPLHSHFGYNPPRDSLFHKPSRDLPDARKAKKDEFYTQLADIERELKHYKAHFKGKTVLCNCDDPQVSEFFCYFYRNFARLQLARLITTCYQNRDLLSFSRHDSKQAVYSDYTGGADAPRPIELKGDGDFRSDECTALLKQADIVCTNPPFSLFREYVTQLTQHNKKFLILGNLNALKYTVVFPLIKKNKIWLGVNNGPKKFSVPPYAEKFHSESDGQKFMHMGNVIWFTNLDHDKRHAPLPITKTYDPDLHPRYDYYEAINVDKVKEIPADYTGAMGVPITFLDKYCPEQFEIMGVLNSAGYDEKAVGIPFFGTGDARAIVNGKVKYARLLIQNKRG